MAAPAWNPSDPTVYENPTTHDLYQVADATGDGQWHVYQTHAEYVWAAIPGQGFTDIVNLTPAQYAAQQAPVAPAPVAAAPPAPAPAPSNPTVSNVGGIGQEQLNMMEQQITAAVSQQASTSDPNEVVQMGQSINAQVVNFQQEAVTGYQSGGVSANQMPNYMTFSTGAGIQSIQQEITTLQNQGGINSSEYNTIEQQYTALNGSVNTSINDMMERDPSGAGRADSSSLRNELSSLQSQINAITPISTSSSGGTTPPQTPLGGQGGSGSSSSGSNTSSTNSTNNNDGSTSSSPSPTGATNTSDSPAPSQLGSGSTVASAAPSTSGDNTAITPAAPVASGGTYTVVSGDTMWGIAQSNNIPLSQLEAMNPQIQNPELIYPGQSINVGSGGVDTSSTNPAAPASGAAYTVVHGDTLSGIAAANGMTTAQIEALNPQIQDPNLIFPGQSINLGSGSSSSGGTSQPSAAAGSSSSVPGGGSSGITGGGSSSGGGAIGFPDKSSYTNIGSETTKADNMTLGEKAEAAGWSDGSGNGTSDIAKNVFEVDNHTSTDPLKIDEKK